MTVYSPAKTLDQSKAQTGQTAHRAGSNVAQPRLSAPAKNSTECTCEIGSARATRWIVAGATNVASFVGLKIRTDGGGFVFGLSLSASKMTSLLGNPTRYGSIGESVGEGTRVATTVSVPSASESLIGLTVIEADAAPAGMVMDRGSSR